MKYVTCLTLSLIVILSGCKKKDSPLPTAIPPADARIQSMRIANENGSPVNFIDELEWNTDLDVLKNVTRKLSNGTTSQLRRYTFAGSNLSYRVFGLNNAPIDELGMDYVLNANGLVATSASLNSGLFYTYMYNDRGHLARINVAVGGVTISARYHYKSQDVLDSVEYFNGVSTKLQVDIFEYETHLGNSVGNRNQGLSFLGKDQKFPLKSQVTYTYVAPDASGIRTRAYDRNFIYTPDNSGRIRTRIINRVDYQMPGLPPIASIESNITYTYR